MIVLTACRSWERRRVTSITGQQVEVQSPIGLVQYAGPGVVERKEVVIESTEQSDFGKRKVFTRRIPLTHVLKMEVLS